MSFVNRLLSFFSITVEDNLYITTRTTELKKKTGYLSGVLIPPDTVLECDWKWDSGVLLGYRKILSGDYIGYFVADIDLRKFEDNPPPEEVAYVILYEADGTTRRFDEVI